MALGPEELESLVLRIHAAPLQPALWAAVVEELRCLMGAQRALLHAPTPGNPAAYWCVPANYETETLAEYARVWAPLDVWAQGAHRRGLTVTGLSYTDDAMVERREFLRSAFFNEFLKPHEVDRHLTVCLDARPTGSAISHTLLGLYRAPGEEAFSVSEVALVQRLVPHLIVATRNHWAAQALIGQNEVSQQALDRVSPAVLAIDARGRLAYGNRSAEGLLRQGEWLRMIDSHLQAGTAVIDSKKCGAVLHNLRAGLGGALPLTDARGRRAMLTTMPTVPPDAGGPSVLGGVVGFVWLVLEQLEADAVLKLAQLFELTAAETRVLQHLSRGLELRDATEHLGLSIHTARNQLKSVLRKTGCRSQSRLLTLVARMAALT